MLHADQKKSTTFMMYKLRSIFLILSGTIGLASSAWAQFCPHGLARSTPDHVFSDAGAGMVLHKPTGLIWKRCAEGQTWNGTTCTGEPKLYLWSEAFERVEAVNAAVSDSPPYLSLWARMFGSIGGAKIPEPNPGAIQRLGQTDWRLPNINELLSVVETACEGPAVNTRWFPDFRASAYWSSSPVVDSPDAAWAMGTVAGLDLPANRWRAALQVQLVRGGKSHSNFDSRGISPLPGAPLSPRTENTPPQSPRSFERTPEILPEIPKPHANSGNALPEEKKLPETIQDMLLAWPPSDQITQKPARMGDPGDQGDQGAMALVSVPSLETWGLGLLSLLLGGMGMRARRRR